MIRMTAFFVALILSAVLVAGPASAQIASSEQELQQLAAALKANDAERRSAIATGAGLPENLARDRRLITAFYRSRS
ncbi:hypothetical protein [Bosea sp. (in: a-proteobacteria)]|uniref:hypothetical protein n=1 Tax=Bosea sp. (in: a-proteobacteria) TaxID=1871050 RepID=UPI00262A1CEC|nr:hypothetical protein [Bosea sp. (in: a-proteobacteria)]MCO5091723.1 hypothetical protein [Bosea sp. (in: a-proteobacteria)]